MSTRATHEALPPAMGPWRSDAARLAGLVGSVEGPSRVAIASRDPPGFLLFGPYARLPRGNFALRLDYAADAPARWDAAFGEAVTMKGALPPSAADDALIRFRVPSSGFTGK